MEIFGLKLDKINHLMPPIMLKPGVFLEKTFSTKLSPEEQWQNEWNALSENRKTKSVDLKPLSGGWSPVLLTNRP